MIYIQKFIKTEDDFPREGKYWVHQMIYEDTLLQLFNFGANHRRLWVNSIDWYLLPVELPTDKAFEGHDKDMLLAKCKQLKGTDGEGWAIGNFVEKILIQYYENDK